MNREPVTLEQVLLACAARPGYRDVGPATIIENAYKFVRFCQERLPELAALERAPASRQAEKRLALGIAPDGQLLAWPKGPTVPFAQAALTITGRKSPRRATERLWRFLTEDSTSPYYQIAQLIVGRGVPEEYFKLLQRDFGLWDVISRRAVAQGNAGKRRKKA
jgi:hypothetical protein